MEVIFSKHTANTAAGLIARMHCKPLFLQVFRKQGMHGKFALMTFASSLYGPVFCGEVGPKITTDGVCVAAAKCINPESPPTNNEDSANKAATSINVTLPAKLTQALLMLSFVVCAPSCWLIDLAISSMTVASCGAPTKMILPPVLWCKAQANSTKYDFGQHLLGHLVVGQMVMIGLLWL